MSYATSQGLGQYRASEVHRFWGQRTLKPSTKRCVVWCHGAGGNYLMGPHEFAFAATVPIMATDLGGGQTWGSDASLAAVDDAWAYAIANFGAADDQMVLWGGSMGSLTAMLYAMEEPDNVAAVGVVLPIMDPEQVRSGPADAADRATGQSAGGATTPSYTADIQAVHGVGAVPNAKRPITRTADLEVPCEMWISETDTVGAKGIAYDFADATDAVAHSIGSVGHSYLAMNNTEPLNFLETYL